MVGTKDPFFGHPADKVPERAKQVQMLSVYHYLFKNPNLLLYFFSPSEKPFRSKNIQNVFVNLVTKIPYTAA